MNKILLILIIILAAVLRIWNLNNFPVGLNADEAAIGYNAYSLLQTGKDEYGSSFPLAFKSFGDYKPGLYFYMTMPFVAVLGLNEWAVRLPSALLGVGTVLLIYFLTKEIFKKESIGLLSAFLLSISPWHLHFSRGSWETNVATFLITLGVLFFVKGLIKRKRLFLSMLAILASMYTYQSPRLVTPVLFLTLFILYKEKLFPLLKSKTTWVSFLILVTLSIPLVLQFTSGEGGARFSGLSFFSDSGPASRVNELRGEHQTPGDFFTKALHNKLTAYGPEFFGHYLDHFKPEFLFINGDPLLRNNVPETGQFYLIESIFLFFGLGYLARRRFEHVKLLISWILIAPIASSITYQTPHALRALSLVIPLTIIMAYGMWLVLNFSGKKKILIVSIIISVILFEFVHYLESYYIHYPKRYPLAWEYGFSEMVTKLQAIESKYDNVVITDRYDQPYILVLFYEKYNPSNYQPQAVLSPRDKFNFGTVREFDKYKFRTIDPGEVKDSPNTLFVGTGLEIPKDANILDMVKFPNGEPAFIFAEGKND